MDKSTISRLVKNTMMEKVWKRIPTLEKKFWVMRRVTEFWFGQWGKIEDNLWDTWWIILMNMPLFKTKLSIRTIQRRPYSHGINRQKERKNLALSEINSKRRIQYCKNMKNHVDSYWRKVFCLTKLR